MLYLNENEWTIKDVGSGMITFTTRIRSINDVRVYDFTKSIEDCGQKIAFETSTFDVVAYGVNQNIFSGDIEFYITVESEEEWRN